LAKHKISIDLITTSEVSVALTLDQPQLLTEEVIQEISEFAEIKIENNFSLVSIVGNEIITTPGISAKTFSSISDYNVRMICLGASKYNMCFLVNAEQGEIVVQKLHKIFLENE
jgi:aspartate kinase